MTTGEIIAHKPYLRLASLIRWPNLLILGAIQTLAYADIYDDGWGILISIILMTGCATAAGYIINDIADQNADALNHRRNIIASGLISESAATRYYFAFVVTGGIFAFVAGWLWSWHLLWIYMLVCLSLRAYAFHLKGLVVIGNVFVSFLCSLSILIVCLPQWFSGEIPGPILQLALFAFVVTWIRELVKDVEDMHGDARAGYRTLPVVAGVAPAKGMIVMLTVFVIAGLFHESIRPLVENRLRLGLWGLTIGLIVISGIVLTLRARIQRHFHLISQLLKVAMITGTLMLLL